MKEGHGKLVLRDGSVYEGDFESGKRNGKGTATYKYPASPSVPPSPSSSLSLPL